jgi:hypothetical protein
VGRRLFGHAPCVVYWESLVELCPARRHGVRLARVLHERGIRYQASPDVGVERARIHRHTPYDLGRCGCVLRHRRSLWNFGRNLCLRRRQLRFIIPRANDRVTSVGRPRQSIASNGPNPGSHVSFGLETADLPGRQSSPRTRPRCDLCRARCFFDWIIRAFCPGLFCRVWRRLSSRACWAD